MKHQLVAIVLATSLATLARGQSPLDRARDAQRVSDEGNARIERAADAAVGASDDKAEPPAAGTPRKAEAARDDDFVSGPVEGSPRVADEGKGQVPPPDTYTIRPGDTLWDLAGRFLNNPWYWPKVWSYNPEITNPHWINPGGVLRFYPSEEEAPTRVGPVADAVENAAEGGETQEEESAEAPRELEDFSRADMKAPPPEEERDAVAVAGPYKIGYHPSKTTAVRHDGFVTPLELEESGTMVGAFDEKWMLSATDKAYAHFKGQPSVKTGETYLVYKTEQPVRHPVSGELFGYQSTVLGTAKVVAVSNATATIVISRAFEPIERGAMLGPWTEKPVVRIERRPNTVELSGRIVASQVPTLTQFGENSVVFVDKGSKDGVQEGNVFTIVRSGDLSKTSDLELKWDPKLPAERVGELLVIDVREKASAALVVRSAQEVLIGDRVEMRPAAAANEKRP